MQEAVKTCIIQAMKRQVSIPAAILSFLFIATFLIVLYGKGYRFGFINGRPDILGTGLLVTTSTPDGAQVLINGHLTTATNNTINLSPGEYTIKIFKEGYFPWEKKEIIKKEVVAKADALLFPTAPKLESITNVGVKNTVLDPSKTRIAFTVASQSAKKNGIYILDLTSRYILTLQSSSKQIVDDTTNLFSDSQFSWSPDGSELIATVSATTYLLSATNFNSNPPDVTETLTSVSGLWEKQKTEKDKSRIEALKKDLRDTVSQNFKILEWSPDETKILYEASGSATLPIIINPRLIGTNSTSEQRKIEKNAMYVYDIKEDKNFKILNALPKEESLQWFTDSGHLIYVHNKTVDILEYDGGNPTTVYAGPFIDSSVFPWSDDSKIVILTNLGNSSIAPNLYTIVLK